MFRSVVTDAQGLLMGPEVMRLRESASRLHGVNQSPCESVHLCTSVHDLLTVCLCMQTNVEDVQNLSAGSCR